MSHQPAPPARKRHRVRNIFLGIVGALVVLIALGAALGGGKSGTPPAASGTTAPGSTAPVVASQGPGIGQPALDGKFRFVVLKVTHAKHAGSGFLGQTAQGEYTILHVRVTNIGSVAQTLDDSAQYVYDAKGRQFSADSQADIYGGPSSGSVFLNQINPGDSVTGKIYFDMPAGDKAVRAELHDSAFSGGISVTLTR